ncbi:MAG: hypothetical protein ACRD8O_02405 [Bryobacteraceae bacterium]
MRSRALVLFVLLAMVALSTAALSPAHWHDSGIAPNCDVCHAGHLPVIQTAVACDVPPPALYELHSSPQDVHHPLEPLLISSPSRAPPA